jgi:hypothetical protein
LLFLITWYKIYIANGNVIIFANMISFDFIKTPYINQDIIPIIKIRYIYNDIPSVFPVSHTLITWGINAIVVHIAAK